MENIYEKLIRVRNKYPKNVDLISQFWLIVFKNDDFLPKKVEIEGFYCKGDIQKVLLELGYCTDKISINHKSNSITVINFL